MQFSKPGTNIELNLLPPYLEFAASGDVKFKADQYQEAFNFSPGLFEAIGTITILDQGAEINLKAKLTRSINEIKVDIIKVDNKNQRIAFGGSPDKYLEVMEGQMIVTGNSWEKLWFDGATIGLGDGIKNPYQNLLHFVADGSVNVAPEDGTVDVSGVDTPFGSISITMDFINMSLHGSLTINTPIATGYCTFVNGSGVLHIDGSGFYFGLGLTVHALSIPVDIQSAVIIGYYPTFDQPLQDLLNDYSYRNEMPMVFNGGVEGFLLSLTIQAVDFEEELDLGFAGFYVNVNAGLNLIIYATFTDPPAVGVELTAFAHLGLELWFLCTNVGVFFNAELIVGGQYVDGDFDLFGCGSLQIGIYYGLRLNIGKDEIIYFYVCLNGA